MKKNLSFFFLLCFFWSNAQIHDPVKWETSIVKVSDTEYELVATALIEDGWHLYSQNIAEDGPVPTSFSFKEINEKFKLIGKVIEEEGHTEFDNIFEMEIKYFEKKTSFKQRVKLLTNEAVVFDETVEYMVCDDTQCLPPTTKELKFSIPARTPSKITSNDKKIIKKSSSFNDRDKVIAPIEDIPIIKVDSANLEIQKDSLQIDNTSIVSADKNTTAEPIEKNKGLLTIFFIAFLSGFAALLTPCVFPMIPMTVSFFTKQSKTRAAGIKNAIIYGLSIIVIYVFLGWIISRIFGADALNALSTNVWFNVLFFLLLIIFAASFLGVFELTLPSSWSTKVDAQADRGGLIGIFFMALALAIVSFSCTGPIVGTLLVEAAVGGGKIGPIIGMLGFSMAIALPFALFAAFPGWLNSLPKSGGWLNTVKVTLGFLELALAFKFLSNADLVLQLHWLEREVFLAIWIAVFGALSLYLFGKVQLPHDSSITSISVGRLGVGLLVLAFTVYLIPGLWGAPLKLISGFPPPMQYSESPYGVGFMGGSNSSFAEGELPEGAKYGPHNIIAFLDYDKGMEYAKKINKPVLLDFTGHACVNCRKMEERVWSDEKVLNLLKNDIVLISLYVDDKRLLSESEQYISKTTGKKIRTIGNKWSDFQIKKYRANAQPYYILLDHNGNNLNVYSAYNPNVDIYYEWLKKGIDNFNK